jgi:hypothetical protein
MMIASLHKRWALIGALLVSTSLATTLSALNPDNPQSEEFKQNASVNRSKIERALREKNQKSDLVHFAVPAMSEIQRLGDIWPQDGLFNEPVRVVLAQDEYEPGSFQLFSFKDRKNITFDISDLKNAKGGVLPASNLDLKVVKIWYQNGNGWNSYFQDIGLRLTPELLLKDENMVLVDTKKEQNYARILTDKGVRYEWISAPIELDKKAGYHRGLFDPFQPGFKDSDTLQPVTLAANQFKQFFLTVHADKEQQPGIYKGTIGVLENGRKIYDIEVIVRVLPFVLPAPLSWRDLDRPFVASMMGGFDLPRLRSMYNPNMTDDDFRLMLINAKKHNLLWPVVNQDDTSGIEMLKELGFPTKPFIGDSGPFVGFSTHSHRLTFDQMMTAKAGAKRARDFYQETLGHTDILMKYGDENGATMIVATRSMYPYFEQYGIKIGNAGHPVQFFKGGYAFGWHMMGSQPDEVYRIKKWKETDAYLSFYAGQHTGSENPQFMRRQHGLLGYMSGLNMTYNYRFAWGPWNDRAHNLYRPMVIAYLTGAGVVDTLQWEGFREAIDDIRYITQLQLLIREAIESGDVNRLFQARKAQQYLTLLNYKNDDLNTIRVEVIEHILKLMELASARS